MLLRRSLTRSSSSVTSSLASLLMSSTIRCCIVFNVPWSSYEKTSFICKTFLMILHSSSSTSWIYSRNSVNQHSDDKWFCENTFIQINSKLSILGYAFISCLYLFLHVYRKFLKETERPTA